ncbi:MAG: hypothetical protein QM820_14870 [Minicystis sp.]
MRCGAAALAIAIACSGIAGSAHADEGQRSRVAIVRPPKRGAAGGARRAREIDDATARLGNELAAAGFEVVLVDAGPEGDARAQVEEGGAAARPFATVAIVDTARGATADVWVADHVTGKTVVRQMHVATGAAFAADVSKILAIRAVELLRASLLEVSVASPGSVTLPPDVARWIADITPPAQTATAQARATAAPATPGNAPPASTVVAEPAPPGNAVVPVPSPPASAVVTAATSPPARPREVRRNLFQGFTLEAGVAALASFGDLARGISPVIRVGFGSAHDIAVRGSFYGPNVGREFQSAAGSGTVHEQVATIEAVYGGGARESWIAPVLSLGGGVYHAHLSGSAGAAGYVGRSDDLWSALLDIGVGVAVRPTARLAIVLDLHALVEQRRPVVDLGGTEAGRGGRPLWLSSIGLVVSP